MLAELAAANAAFSVIKTAIQNGREIADAGSAIAKFVGAKEDLQKKASKKGGGSDLEEFMALEQIREQEEQLKQIMIYTCLLYTSPSPRDVEESRMPSSA